MPASRPTEDREADEDGAERDRYEGNIVGHLTACALTNLVEAQDLVLDRAVVEVEAAHTQEDPTREWSTRPTSELGPPHQQDDKAPYEDRRRHGVEDAVGDQRRRTRRPVIEMMPPKQLMQDDLVECAGDAYSDHQSRQCNARKGCRVAAR